MRVVPVEPIPIEERHDAAGDEHVDGIEKPAAKLVEVVEEPHPRLGYFIILIGHVAIGGERIEIGRVDSHDVPANDGLRRVVPARDGLWLRCLGSIDVGRGNDWLRRSDGGR